MRPKKFILSYSRFLDKKILHANQLQKALDKLSKVILQIN